MPSPIATIVRLADGEEFAYYVEVKVYLNPESGEWRVVTNPPEFSEDRLFVRQVLLQCATKYASTYDEEKISTRKEIETEKAAANGCCPTCGRGNGLMLSPVQKVVQELMAKKKA